MQFFNSEESRNLWIAGLVVLGFLGGAVQFVGTDSILFGIFLISAIIWALVGSGITDYLTRKEKITSTEYKNGKRYINGKLDLEWEEQRKKSEEYWKNHRKPDSNEEDNE